MKNIAFIGTSHIHTPNFISKVISNIKINCIGVWDKDKNRSKSDSEKLQCKNYDNYIDLLKEPNLDGVIVCSETNLHYELVKKITENKKHCFIEKPLGIGKKDSFEMANLIETSKIIFQTGYFMRSNPVYIKLKQLITDNYFGEISRIRLINCHDGIMRDIFKDYQWMTDPKVAGVGAFGDLGTHVLDLLLWFFSDVESVSATFTKVYNRYPGCEESGEALIKFKSGLIASIAAGWIDIAQPYTIFVSGTKAHARTTNDQLIINENKEGKKIERIEEDLTAVSYTHLTLPTN